MSGRLVGVDVGGTFTDVIAVEDGNVVISKVPSDYSAQNNSVLVGARDVDVGRASVFNLASTKGLNAIITRNMPKVGFLTNTGHRDLLDRGTMSRPADALTDPAWRRSFSDAARPLVPRYLRRGVAGRITAAGDELIALDEAGARTEIRLLGKCNVQGIAICLINSYVNDFTRSACGNWCAKNWAISPARCRVRSHRSRWNIRAPRRPSSMSS